MYMHEQLTSRKHFWNGFNHNHDNVLLQFIGLFRQSLDACRKVPKRYDWVNIESAKNDQNKNYIKIDLLFRSIIDWFYIDYRHNRDDCVLVDERHVLGVMSRPQRPQGGAHVSAQPDRWRQLQNQHQHRWHPTDQVLLRVSRGCVCEKLTFF